MGAFNTHRTPLKGRDRYILAAEGSRVNAASPGLSYTDIHASGGEHSRVDRWQDSVPMKRGSSADEVARAVMWLLSEDASYVTGTHVDVSGGG